MCICDDHSRVSATRTYICVRKYIYILYSYIIKYRLQLLGINYLELQC